MRYMVKCVTWIQNSMWYIQCTNTYNDIVNTYTICALCAYFSLISLYRMKFTMNSILLYIQIGNIKQYTIVLCNESCCFTSTFTYFKSYIIRSLLGFQFFFVLLIQIHLSLLIREHIFFFFFLFSMQLTQFNSIS